MWTLLCVFVPILSPSSIKTCMSTIVATWPLPQKQSPSTGQPFVVVWLASLLRCAAYTWNRPGYYLQATQHLVSWSLSEGSHVSAEGARSDDRASTNGGSDGRVGDDNHVESLVFRAMKGLSIGEINRLKLAGESLRSSFSALEIKAMIRLFQSLTIAPVGKTK